MPFAEWFRLRMSLIHKITPALEYRACEKSLKTPIGESGLGWDHTRTTQAEMHQVSESAFYKNPNPAAHNRCGAACPYIILGACNKITRPTTRSQQESVWWAGRARS